MLTRGATANMLEKPLTRLCSHNMENYIGLDQVATHAYEKKTVAGIVLNDRATTAH